MQNKTLVIMAAGIGSRFGGLKQIETVGLHDEVIVDYSIYDAIKVGFTKVVFIIKREIEEAFKEKVGNHIAKYIDVGYAYQEIEDIPLKKELINKRNKPWGTVQAILCSKDLVEGDFVVINADDFYGLDSYKKASNFLDNFHDENTYACISYPYINTASKNGSVKRAVCFTENDNIYDLVESKISTLSDFALAEPLDGSEAFKIDLNRTVSMNMFAFKHSIFQLLEEYFNEYFNNSDEYILNNEALLPEVIKSNLNKGKIVLKNVVSNGEWLGITYKEDLIEVKEKIKELIKRGEYPEKLWN